MFSILFDCFYLKISYLFSSDYIRISAPRWKQKPWRVLSPPASSGDITRQGFCVTWRLIFWYVTLEAMWYMYYVHFFHVCGCFISFTNMLTILIIVKCSSFSIYIKDCRIFSLCFQHNLKKRWSSLFPWDTKSKRYTVGGPENQLFCPWTICYILQWT